MGSKTISVYFQIDYYQKKANRTAIALFYFFQKNNNKEKKLRIENTQIFHCMQPLPTNSTLSGLSVLIFSPLH